MAKSKSNNGQQNSFSLHNVRPLTDNQERIFDSYYADKNLLITGYAGTGKSFVACYLAVNDILSGEADQKKVLIYRSTVPTRDLGFLPGSAEEKSKPYELPYYGLFAKMTNRREAYDILKQKGIVDFESTSFLRGITLDNYIIIVDECQNLTWHEIASLMTRLGRNSRIIFCGDHRQTDFTLKQDKEREGIHKLSLVASKMRSFDHIEMDSPDDIVRGPVVKDFIIQATALSFL